MDWFAFVVRAFCTHAIENVFYKAVTLDQEENVSNSIQQAYRYQNEDDDSNLSGGYNQDDKYIEKSDFIVKGNGYNQDSGC